MKDKEDNQTKARSLLRPTKSTKAENPVKINLGQPNRHQIVSAKSTTTVLKTRPASTTIALPSSISIVHTPCKSIQCLICGAKGFPYLGRYKEHLAGQHFRDRLVELVNTHSEESGKKCFRCDKWFSEKKHTARHVGLTHHFLFKVVPDNIRLQLRTLGYEPPTE